MAGRFHESEHPRNKKGEFVSKRRKRNPENPRREHKAKHRAKRSRR